MAAQNDDLGADIEAAIASASGAASPEAAPSPAPAVAEAPAPDVAAPEVAAEAPKGDDRPRGPDGKFAPKAEATKVEGPAIPAQPQAPAPAQPETKQAIPAPQNWKGAGKVQWDKLPPAIRQEIAEDYSRLNQTSAQLEKLNSAIGPERAQVLAATYGSVEQGLQNLFAISDMATKNPAGFVLWFAQQRGVNLAEMVGQHGAQGQQPMQQAPDPIQQELAQLRQMVQGFAQQQQQSALNPVIAEINRFASDPAHPYWNDVEPQVVALLKSDRVPGNSPSERLQNAYEMAIWAHPEIRSTLIADQVNARTQQQAQTVSQALNASVSVSGSPAGARVAQQAEPVETLEETIRRAQRAHSS